MTKAKKPAAKRPAAKKDAAKNAKKDAAKDPSEEQEDLEERFFEEIDNFVATRPYAEVNEVSEAKRIYTRPQLVQWYLFWRPDRETKTQKIDHGDPLRQAYKRQRETSNDGNAEEDSIHDSFRDVFVTPAEQDRLAKAARKSLANGMIETSVDLEMKLSTLMAHNWKPSGSPSDITDQINNLIAMSTVYVSLQHDQTALRHFETYKTNLYNQIRSSYATIAAFSYLNSKSKVATGWANSNEWITINNSILALGLKMQIPNASVYTVADKVTTQCAATLNLPSSNSTVQPWENSFWTALFSTVKALFTGVQQEPKTFRGGDNSNHTQAKANQGGGSPASNAFAATKSKNDQ